MSQRSVLVTGGFGYIGGRLCRYLANQDQATVVAMSRRPDADWPAGECKQPQVRVCDLADRNRDLNEITEGVDAIVHLAALDAAASADNPVAAIDLNTTATMRLLQSAVATGVKRFIYVSTIHVYRSPLEGVIDEARRDCAQPLVMNPAVGRMGNVDPPPRPGQSDIGQPPLFLQGRRAAFVEGALVVSS